MTNQRNATGSTSASKNVESPKTSNAEAPDIELILGLGSLTGDISGSMRTIFGFSDDWYEKVFRGYEGRDAFSIVPILLHPKSRGRVTLRNGNPLYWPVLEANYYDVEDDLKTMVRGIRKVGRIYYRYLKGHYFQYSTICTYCHRVGRKASQLVSKTLASRDKSHKLLW